MNRSEFSVRDEPVDLAEVAREAVRRHEARREAVRRRARGRRARRRGSRATTTGCCRSRRTWSRTRCARRPPAGAVTVTRGAGHAERRRHGPGHRRRRPAARVRALLPLRQGRQGPARRQRARAGDRAAARARDGRRRARRERRGAGRRSRSGYGRSFEVSTTSKSEPCSAPSACSWSFDQCGLGAPETYQFEPLSATIIP